MTIAPEYIASLAAMAVFVTVLCALHSASMRRKRDDARRQWQTELRTRGA